MARDGAVLDNPVTGERIEFRRTGREADGEALAFDYSLRPGGFALGYFDHLHPRQEERIEVQSGRLGVRIDGDEWTATTGTRFAIPAGTPHTLRNDGSEAVHAVVELRPALDLASLFETTSGLARDGKANRFGLPGPLQLAVVADAFREEFAFAAVPLSVQRALVAAVAPFGRLAGYRARYPRYGGREAARRRRP